MPDAIWNQNTARAFPGGDARQDPPTGVINGRGVPQGSRLRPKTLVKEWRIRAGTWNVGTLTGRLREIVDVMERRRIDILCVQETRWKGCGTREIGSGYKLYYSGSREGRNGVGIIVSNNWKGKVIEVKRVNDRLLRIPIIVGDKIVQVISAYAPQMGCEEQEKEAFRNVFETAIRTVKEEEKLIIGADLNGRVGRRRDGYEEVHGGHGFGVRNEDGEYILEMAHSFELACMNTWFQKFDRHLITYESGGIESQIDYILVRREDKRNVTNCKVILGEACVKQHRLLVMDWKIKGRKPKKRKRRSRLKVWNLKGEKCEQFKAKVRERQRERLNLGEGLDSRVENIWVNMKEICVGEAENVVGRTSGYGVSRDEKWWWNGEVQEAVKRKSKAFKDWKVRHEQGAQNQYIEEERYTRRRIGIAIRQVAEELNERLETRDGEKDIYKIANLRKRQRQDVGQLCVIKDRDGNILHRDEDIKRRWREYFEELLNNENEREELDEVPKVEGPVMELKETEVKRAISKMKNCKAPGPSEFQIEMIKALGREGEEWMKDLLRAIWEEEEMPRDWEESLMIYIFKQKGDIMECGNHRGIKLTEHGLKVLERILDERLREIVKIGKQQYGFMKGRGTLDAIFIVRQLQEKRLEGNQKLFCAFIDLEKAYDRIPREVVFWCLRKRKVPEKLVRLVEMMYRRTRTKVLTTVGETETFEVSVGLHQGSALSPFLFVLVMDVLSREIRNEELWELLYADDLVITAENEVDLQRRVTEWQESLERGGLKMNVNKTEVMVSSKEGGDRIAIQDIRGSDIKQVEKFKYLGSTLSQEGGCEAEVESRIKAAWGKWREVSGVVCDKKMPVKLKVKIYITVIRPVLIYGSEAWALRRKEEAKLERTEMRMLRWIMGVSLLERLENDDIRRMAGIVKITEVIRVGRLRWFGHVLRMDGEEGVRKAWEEPVRGRRSRGRQKIRWRDKMKDDMERRGLVEEDAFDRRYWRRSIRQPTP